MTFKSFVISRHFCTLMLLQKGFFYQGDSQEDYGSNYNSSTSKWWPCEPRWWISRLPLDLEPQYTLYVTYQQVKWCTNKWVVAQFNVKKLLGKVKINKTFLDKETLRKENTNENSFEWTVRNTCFLGTLSTRVHMKSLQSCPTLCNPMGQGQQGSSVGGILRREYWSRLPCPPPGDLPNPGIRPASLMCPASADESLPVVLPGKL